MNPFVKAVIPTNESPRTRILRELGERPGQTMLQIAENVGLVYSTVRTSLRVLRNDGLVRQQPTDRKSNAKWESGRDNAYLKRMNMAGSVDDAPPAFVAFHDPMHAYLFGPAKQSTKGNSNE